MTQQRIAPCSLAKAWQKALAANYAGSYPTVAPCLAAAQSGGRPTPASGQALIDFGSNLVPSEIHIVPFGVGTAGNTIKIRVWGFRACVGGYIGVVIWEGTGTLCTQVGTTGFDVNASNKFCDTVTTVTGTESVDCRTTSPGSNVPGKVKILTAGAEFLMIDFDKNNATSANALIGAE